MNIPKEYLVPDRWTINGHWDVSSMPQDIGSEYDVEGSLIEIDGVASIDRAGENDLSFCSSDGTIGKTTIMNSSAGIIFCKKSMIGLVHPKPHSQLVFLNNPRLAFVTFVNAVRQRNRQSTSERSIILDAKVADSAKIGLGCFIGENVTIGPNCVLEDNVYIGDGAVLAQNCYIGERSVIQPRVVLGADGFAFERLDDQTLERFPHFAGTILGKGVEICAGSSIARGSLSNTIIGDGTKIDALVHVAHNSKIGKNCQITAGTIIGGSATIGDCCWTGLNCTIKDHVKLGNNVLVGAGACVIHDVPEGDIVAGVPAKSIKHKTSTSDVFLMAGHKTSG